MWLAFASHVHLAGYEFVDADDERFDTSFAPRIREPWNPLGTKTPRLYLCAKSWDYGGKGMSFRHCSPTQEDSSLFLNFAALEPEPNAIAKFANRYGFLFGTHPEGAEPFSEWEYEICTMRFLEDLRSGKRSTITELFRPDRRRLISFPHQDLLTYSPYGVRVDRSTKDPMRATALSVVVHATGTGRKPSEAAEEYLSEALNARLAATNPSVRLGGAEGLQVTPARLIDALWIQFATAVAEARRYRKCRTCGRQFELDPDQNRKSRHYCSDACRSKAYRTRQAKAARRNRKGK
jgi:hypothetical protein